MPTLETLIYGGNTVLLLIAMLEIAELKRAMIQMAQDHDEVEVKEPALYQIIPVK